MNELAPSINSLILISKPKILDIPLEKYDKNHWGVFPHLYSHQESGWYHWNGSTDALRLFYRYSDAQWVDFSNSSTGGKL